MSAQLPEGFEFNGQGLVVTDVDNLSKYISSQIETRIDEYLKAEQAWINDEQDHYFDHRHEELDAEFYYATTVSTQKPKHVTYDSLPDNYLFVSPVEWTILESQLPAKYHFKEDSLEYPSVEIGGDRYIYLPLSIEDKTFYVIRGSRPVSNRVIGDR